MHLPAGLTGMGEIFELILKIIFPLSLGGPCSTAHFPTALNRLEGKPKTVAKNIVFSSHTRTCGVDGRGGVVKS